MRCISICLQPAPNCDSCQIVFVSALYCFILKICLANSKLYNQLASPNTSHQLWAHEYTFQTPTYCTINPQYLTSQNQSKSYRLYLDGRFNIIWKQFMGCFLLQLSLYCCFPTSNFIRAFHIYPLTKQRGNWTHFPWAQIRF